MSSLGGVAVVLGALGLCGGLPGLQGAHGSVEDADAKAPGNLLTGNQASFTTSTGGWVGIDADLSWVPTAGDATPGALGVTATAGSGMGAASGSSSSGGLVAATPGFVYAASAAAEAVTQDQNVEPLLAFYNSSGAEIDTVFGPQTQALTGSWTQATEVSAIAPSATAWVALQVDAPSTTPGDEIYVDDAWIQGVQDEVPAVAGPLHTSGNEIVQANGDPLVLHGVVLAGLGVNASASATGLTEQSIVEAKAWGANFVRLPLGEQFWLSSNCGYVPTYESEVDQAVQWITSLGMVALLDLSTNTVNGCETGEQHNMADEAQSPTFWSEVAERYGDPSSPEYNPLVAFDLHNEPHNIPDSVWLNGGSTTDVYAPNETYQAAGMQQLYDTVRDSGAQNLVFISGNNWANDPPSTLVSGTDIVYAVHVYTCPRQPAARIDMQRQSLRPIADPRQLVVALVVLAGGRHGVRMAQPVRRYLQRKCDRLRRGPGLGLGCVRVAGRGRPHRVRPDPPLSLRRDGGAISLGHACPVRVGDGRLGVLAVHGSAAHSRFGPSAHDFHDDDSAAHDGHLGTGVLRPRSRPHLRHASDE